MSKRNLQSVLFETQQRYAFNGFKKRLYAALSLIALSIYVMQRSGFQLPSLINNYVNDLLCLPLTLGVITYIIRDFKKDNSFELSIGFIVLLTGYYSFYFEYYLPQFNSRYTADFIDVVLYFIGGFAFFFRDKMKFVMDLGRNQN
jgi:hypothetical protein